MFLFPEKTDRPLFSDDELENLSKNHNYWRTKHITDVIAIIVCVVLVFLAVAIVVAYASDASFREFILGQIKSNFSGLVFTSLAILGIKVGNKN